MCMVMKQIQAKHRISDSVTTDQVTIKVRKTTRIRNRYNQVPHMS